MNTIPNRQIICDVLCEQAKIDPDIVVLTSDSRGSASLTGFGEKFPARHIEMGIAEQSLVSTAAGLALAGKKPFAASPACFLSTRSLEQVKVDCAYSDTNVKLIGISGGLSYGPLGATHHSLQDIAGFMAIPNIRIYLPSDRFVTSALIKELIKDKKPAYIRVGRNAVEDVYDEEPKLDITKAIETRPGHDMTIIACGELVKPAVEASELLALSGISCRVIDMFSVKPLDVEAVIRAAEETSLIITAEEHSIYGGMGSAISQITASIGGCRTVNLAIPDEFVISGTSKQVMSHYGLDAEGIRKTAEEYYKGQR